MKGKERMLDKNNMTFKLEKITILQVSENQMSRNELSKKKSLQENGITLIALVVTIIILLILAGVTLNIALSDNGLFSKTQEAAEKYKQAQEDEEEAIDFYSYLMEKTTFNYTGEVQEYEAPKDGIYELEVWGAQGGDATCEVTVGLHEGTTTTYTGGKGGHSKGTIRLNEGDILYVCVGGQGKGATKAGESLERRLQWRW